MQTYRGFPVTEQVRLSESPSRKMPEGGTILTVGATVGRHKERGGGEISEDRGPDHKHGGKKNKKNKSGMRRRQ